MMQLLPGAEKWQLRSVLSVDALYNNSDFISKKLAQIFYVICDKFTVVILCTGKNNIYIYIYIYIYNH
jgi:hypothetical protein